MENCKPHSTMFQGVKLTKECDFPKVNAIVYRKIVGSLICLTHSRPNITFVVSFVSKFMENLRKSHLKAAKMIIRYITGTYQLGIKYFIQNLSQFDRYTNYDWVGVGDDQKTTSRYVFHQGSGLIVWSCKMQQSVSLSTANI